MISVSGLRKAYGEQLVLDGIDLEVEPGTVFALLGPNGSGKTTTVQILSTLLASDSGSLTVAGHDVNTQPDAVKWNSLGYLYCAVVSHPVTVS